MLQSLIKHSFFSLHVTFFRGVDFQAHPGAEEQQLEAADCQGGVAGMVWHGTVRYGTVR